RLVRLSAYRALLLAFAFRVAAPPPSSPLVPYTTLFRSQLAGDDCCHGRQEVHRKNRRSGALRHRRDHRSPDQGQAREGQSGELLDRKSTRLNSSHAKISYAVFCLKKKIT